MSKISVIIPVYNAEKTLKRLAKALLVQIDKDFEAVFINDGSTDKSGEILKEICQSEKNFRVITTKNGGAAAARNLGIDKAEWNGHLHQPIPKSSNWIYLVQYTAGAEGWNCTDTNVMIFYSYNYSYKTTVQAAGRIDRLNTPFQQIYYYHLTSKAGIDLAIKRALDNKKQFNEANYIKKLH
jgi:glycosyltransferase involved in cell wall biosynthesis